MFKKITSKQITPICTALVAVVFIYLGLTKYGFWGGVKGPLPGFVPTIVAVGLLAMSILALLQSFKEDRGNFPPLNWMAAAGALGVILATFVIGMIPSIAIYVILWLKLFEKASWKNTLIVWCIIMAIVVGVFVLWLAIPFPNGIIGDMIMG